MDALDLSRLSRPRTSSARFSTISAETLGDREINLMEVCGTHTVSIGRYGFRSTPARGAASALRPGVPGLRDRQRRHRPPPSRSRECRAPIIATFGDMIRVPGSNLFARRREGRRRGRTRGPTRRSTPWSLRRQTPSARSSSWVWALRPPRPPSRRASSRRPARELANFSVFCVHKTTPAALLAIASDPRDRHRTASSSPATSSTITGLAPYRFLVNEFSIPGVVTGFEPVDVLEGIARLVELRRRRGPRHREPPSPARRRRRGQRGPRGVWSSRYSNPATPHGAASGACRAPASPSATPSPALTRHGASPLRSSPRASTPAAVAAMCSAASSRQRVPALWTRVHAGKTPSAPVWSRARAAARSYYRFRD